MTPEQERALALARARRRREAGGSQQPANAPSPSQERTFGQAIYDNVIGDPNDGVDSWGERAGRTINDAAKAGLAGFSRGVTGLIDLPGTAFNAGSDLLAAGLGKAGLVSPELAQGAREQLRASIPWGASDAGDLASALTGGATEYRGDTTAGKYAGTVGEFLPGALLAGGGTVANAVRYGVVPGLASEGAGQMTEGTAAEPWARAIAPIVAAPVAHLAEQGVRRAISPYGGADAGRLDLARVLDEHDVPVTAGQRVGSESLRRKEGLTQAGRAFGSRQEEELTRAALRTAGSDASRATPEALSEASRRIGSVFEDVAKGVDVRPDAGTVSSLKAANATYQQLAPKTNQAPIIGQVATRMGAALKNGETIPASTLNTWRSNLSKLTASGDNATRSAATEALSAVDNALESTLVQMGRGGDVARLATAREQWRNFLAIQKAASGAGEATATGILSPSTLRSAVAQQGRAAYAQGRRGDLGELSRAAEAVMKRLPTSGTAENIRAMGIPALGWTGGGAGAGAAMGGPVGAIVGSALGAAVPGAMGAARMSGPMQSYLANQLVGQGGGNIPSGLAAALLGAQQQYQER